MWPHERVAPYAIARCDDAAIRRGEERGTAEDRVCAVHPHGSFDGKTGSAMCLGGSCRSRDGLCRIQPGSRSMRLSTSWGSLPVGAWGRRESRRRNVMALRTADLSLGARSLLPGASSAASLAACSGTCSTRHDEQSVRRCQSLYRSAARGTRARESKSGIRTISEHYAPTSPASSRAQSAPPSRETRSGCTSR